MYSFPIGVMLESFRLPAADAIRCAAELGVQGIHDVLHIRGNTHPKT